MTDYLVKASSLLGFSRTVEELGGEAEPLLSWAGLTDPDKDPEAWISYRRFVTLLEEASRVTRCPHFGLRLSRHQDIGILGTVGFVMQQAPDLRTALKELASYFVQHNQGAIVSVEVDKGIAHWRYSSKLQGKLPNRQESDLVAGMGLNVMRLLWKPNWHPNAVYLAHAPTEDIGLYRRHFDCPVMFNWESSFMTFDPAILDARISQANPNLYRVLENYLSNLQLAFPDDYLGKIRYLIKQAMSTGDCSIERIAQFLAVNKRTLQRQLNAQDTSYKELLQEVRCDIAQQYLQQSTGSLTTLADMLCYSDLSTFSNAFRSLFGVSPREWRKRHAPGGTQPAQDYSL
jgi:AraC-like DNA-binding protein